MLFPVETDRNYSNIAAKSAVTQLATALNVYYAEYGHWPDFVGDGNFLDAERNSQLIRSLTVRDIANNPRRITYFEAPPARESGNGLTNGITPEGVFVDPWGHPYRIILKADHSGVIASPYLKDPKPKVQTHAIVWSLGKDGKQGAPKDEQTSRGSDDIKSWE